MRHALLFLSALLVAYAQSQQPSPTSAKQSRDKQEQTASKDNQAGEHNQQSQHPPLTINQYNAQPNTQQVPEGAAEKDKSALLEFINAISTMLLAVFTLLLAFATGALCVVAYFQWRTMQGHEKALSGMAEHMQSGLIETRKAADAATKSAEVSEMALKLTQRADILVDAISIVDKTGAGFQIAPNNHVTVTFKNFGRTRAENVIYKLTLDIPGVPESDYVNGPETLGPGDTQTISFIDFGMFLKNPQTINDLTTGKIIMRVKGTVSYGDVFGECHEIEVLSRYSLRIQGFRREQHPDPEDVENS